MMSNVFFLVIDSLRSSKCKDSNNSFTPNLDKLIKKGVFFDQTVSAAPITIPSLSSMFTGLYPFECTTLNDNKFNLNKDLPTFLNDFNTQCYNTFAILPEILKHTNIPGLFSKTEFFNSFSTLYDENLGNRIMDMLTQRTESPWFIFIHLTDLHGLANFHFDNACKTKIESLSGNNQYEKMLSAIDPWLGKIFELINLENTLCVITSDHGSISADFTKDMSDFCIDLENERTKKNQTVLDSKNIRKITTKLPKRFEKLHKNMSRHLIKTRDKKTEKFLESRINLERNLHLSSYHKRLLKKSWLEPKECFDESFRPTLIFVGHKVPQKKIISKQISTLDIFPTILKLLDVNTSIRHRGESLLELINNGEYKKKMVMIDGASDDSKAKQSDAIGLRTEEYKYFRGRNSGKSNYHLYNLKEDPLELNNIFEENDNIVKKFEEELKKISPTGNFKFKRSEKFTAEKDIEIEEELKKMGYI